LLPSRCTRGFCLISFLLISCALILDDTAILFAGGALVIGILGQYLLFDASVREIIASVEIQRSLSRNPVRKGSLLHVSTTVTARGAARMQVQVADLPPIHTLPVDGVTTVTLKADPSPQVHQLRYQILPDISGTQHFSGVRVTVRNLFFEDTITLAREGDCGPALLVQPSGFFEAPASELSEGNLYSRNMSIWRGVDFHSLREYCPGDDTRRVDWKISAKFGKIFIKQYHEQINFPPFLIVDLPWGSAPFPKKEFDQLVSEVTGRIQHTIETCQFVSVLLISGPNILHLIREEQNLSRCISELREWMHPVERVAHFYHMKDRSDLRSHVKECELARRQATDPGLQAFYETMRDRYLSVLQYEQTPAFTGQVRKILSQIVVNDAYILSLGYGDTSHIWLLAQMLQSRNVRVHIRIMDAGDAREARV
jgi:uncharacterized protein (DUF58 family)